MDKTDKQQSDGSPVAPVAGPQAATASKGSGEVEALVRCGEEVQCHRCHSCRGPLPHPLPCQVGRFTQRSNVWILPYGVSTNGTILLPSDFDARPRQTNWTPFDTAMSMSVANQFIAAGFVEGR